MCVIEVTAFLHCVHRQHVYGTSHDSSIPSDPIYGNITQVQIIFNVIIISILEGESDRILFPTQMDCTTMADDDAVYANV